MRHAWLAPGLALALALGLAAGGAAAHQPSQRSAAELMDVLMWGREPIGGPFTLVDQQGRKRTDRDFRGKLLLVYFGYTTCQDVCPADLQQIGAAIESLGPAGEAVQPLFITLDPARDTSRRLAAYVPSFHPRLVGLGGSEAAVRKAADAYRVFFRKVPIGANGDYGIDHAAFIYLMDRQGGYLGFFPPGTSASRMAEVIRPQL
jgi:cytochrome oxidase Cu insertion factor (SCO1/SenC/PrrC family)